MSEILEDFLEGLQNYFRDHTELRKLVSNRLYLVEAPSNAKMPYVVYHIPNISLEETFDNKYDEVLVQFNIFDDSASALKAISIYVQLSNINRWREQLSIANGEVVRVDRDFVHLDKLKEDKCWQIVCQFRFKLTST